jgi:GMP synthase (glutamine-hydrolysing)
MNIYIIQHVPYETAAYIETWAARHHHRLHVLKMYESPEFPPLESIDTCIVLGGPMNVYEEERYPWLYTEKKFIEQIIGRQIPIVGICLGAQLLAQVLGARIFQNMYKEIGWHHLTLYKSERVHSPFDSLPDTPIAFHWHGDRFEIPAGAHRLAASEACENQAFLSGENILGVQFHFESTRESIENLLRYNRNDMNRGAFVQTPGQIRQSYRFIPQINAMIETVLTSFID